METALILIDIQNDYFPGGRHELNRTAQAAENAAKVLAFFRKARLPVFHVQHVSLSKDAPFFVPDTDGVTIHADVAPLPGEEIFIKHVPSSFYKTGLHERLSSLQIEHLVICGMMSHMCVDTTVRAAKDLGYAQTLIDDACTTADLQWGAAIIDAETVHRVYMASLNGTFAKVQKADEFLAACAE